METHNQQEKRISGFTAEFVGTKHMHKRKEKQLGKSQMSAKEQIGMEVRNVTLPIVHAVAQQNVMFLAINIVPNLVKESVDDLDILKQFPQKMPSLLDSLDSHKYLSENEVSIEEASSITMDVFRIDEEK